MSLNYLDYRQKAVSIVLTEGTNEALLILVKLPSNLSRLFTLSPFLSLLIVRSLPRLDVLRTIGRPRESNPPCRVEWLSPD